MRCATLLLASALGLLAACSPGKLLERGRPEAAYERAVRRLERDPSGKRALVAAAAEAYETLQASDYAEAAILGDAPDDPFGERRVALLAQLDARRTRVAALRRRLTRVMHLESWDAEPDYAAELRGARAETAAAFARAAAAHLPAARAGDRFAAREAHALLVRREAYAERAGERSGLRAELHDLGTLRVAYEVRGARPADRSALGRQLGRQLEDKWVAVRSAGATDVDWADVYATLTVDPVPGPRLTERTETEGFARDITTTAVVGVDTAGQKVLETSVERVTAQVQTVTRTYRIRVTGRLTLSRPSGVPLSEREVEAATERHYASATLTGDARALGETSLPASVPDDFGAADARTLRRAAVAQLGRCLPRVDVDRAFGSERLASTE